jgi:hypothetical protein
MAGESGPVLGVPQDFKPDKHFKTDKVTENFAEDYSDTKINLDVDGEGKSGRRSSLIRAGSDIGSETRASLVKRKSSKSVITHNESSGEPFVDPTQFAKAHMGTTGRRSILFTKKMSESALLGVRTLFEEPGESKIGGDTGSDDSWPSVTERRSTSMRLSKIQESGVHNNFSSEDDDQFLKELAINALEDGGLSVFDESFSGLGESRPVRQGGALSRQLTKRLTTLERLESLRGGPLLPRLDSNGEGLLKKPSDEMHTLQSLHASVRLPSKTINVPLASLQKKDSKYPWEAIDLASVEDFGRILKPRKEWKAFSGAGAERDSASDSRDDSFGQLEPSLYPSWEFTKSDIKEHLESKIDPQKVCLPGILHTLPDNIRYWRSPLSSQD